MTDDPGPAGWTFGAPVPGSGIEFMSNDEYEQRRATAADAAAADAEARAQDEPMPTEEALALAEHLRGFLTWLQQAAGPPRERPPLLAKLEDFLGVAPQALPAVSESFYAYQHVNVQAGLDAVVGEADGPVELIGVSGQGRRHQEWSELLESARHGHIGIGAPDYADLPVDPDTTRACVAFGVYLLPWRGRRHLVAVRGPAREFGTPECTVSVTAQDTAAARELLAALRAAMREHDVFRGQVISLEGDHRNPSAGLTLLRRPQLGREDVVLPDGFVETLERQVVGVAAHRERLTASGQHLKRGVLLYGPPGTGKTHTVRYLLSRLEGFTAVVLSGATLRFIASACQIARDLQPALVVLEDCDLIAHERDFDDGNGNPLLFTVLNEMDGLGTEADVVFLLTTNRVDVLETALVERPGRVDTALEVGLPDDAARAALFTLYARGTDAAAVDVARVVARSAGATASFLKELVRRSALIAAEREPGEGVIRLDDAAVGAALDELEGAGALLARRLLGVSEPAGTTAG